MKLRFSFILLGVILLSCSKVQQSNIPIYEVYFKIDLRYEDKDLVGALNFKEFKQARNASEKVGFGGLLVLCGYDGVSYYAFDLSCPYEARKATTIKCGTDGTATCPTCESVFEVGYGSGLPTTGPAADDPKLYHLRSYPISGSGSSSQVMYVHN